MQVASKPEMKAGKKESYIHVARRKRASKEEAHKKDSKQGKKQTNKEGMKQARKIGGKKYERKTANQWERMQAYTQESIFIAY